MRRRRNKFRPLAEALEGRIALSAQVGVSLDYNSYWNYDPIWTDLHNLAAPWTPDASGTTLSLTADGYPLADATTSFALNNYPAGNYEFSYTGDGTVSFNDAGTLAGPVTVSDGVTTGTVDVNSLAAAQGTLYMNLTNVNPADPIDNFHLMMPGYGNGTTPEPMFTPAFLQALAPFSDIRFLNWDDGNNSTITNWSQRIQPDDFLTDQDGVPYEDMIALCNEAQKDMWINIPADANTQYVQDLAQMIDSELDPNLNVYVEFGNENWNAGFWQYSEIAAAALNNPLVSKTAGQYQQVAQQSAYDQLTDGEIFDEAFGSSDGRVRSILGGQAAWTQFAEYELQFVQQEYGAPSDYFYATSVAPYISPDGAITSTTTLATFFADMEDGFTEDFIPWVTADEALAERYDLRLVAYEGGESMSPGEDSGPVFNVENQAQDDPRMYQLYVQMIDEWQQLGGGLFDAYQLDGAGSRYGFWGLLPNVTVAGSAKYDALLSTIGPPGDANDDGTVDYADFQAVQANYELGTTTYWTQGDFDDEGTTNWSDLDILRQNLDPAGFTLAQFAQQAVFGEPASVDTPTALEYDGYGVTYASGMTLSSTAGTVEPNQDASGQPIVLGGAGYSEGLGFAGNSSTTLALDGEYSRFDSTIGVDSSGSTASAVIFQVYNGTTLLYQSPTMTSASAPVPIDLNVAGVQQLELVVEAAPGSTVADDHGVWGDARLISTANFGSAQPYTLTWNVSRDGKVLSTQTADSFAFAAVQGTYTISLIVTDSQGQTATASTSVTVDPDGASATFLQKDAVTQGNWVGVYGSQGYDLQGDDAVLPSFATVTFSGASTDAWKATTTDPRPVLETPSGSAATAATCWYGSRFSIDVDLTDGQVHDLALYALDYDAQGRTETIQLIDAATGSVLSTESISSFSGGDYLQWAVSGNVIINVTCNAGPNAVISGLFLDKAPPGIAKEDATTEGTWIGKYGSQGYDILGSTADLPSYAGVTFSGAATATWTTSTTTATALQKPGGSGREAACWYGQTFSIDVDLTDGQTHLLSLYAVDYDNQRRAEQIQLVDAATGAVLDSQDVASFSRGVYLQWMVSGDVIIEVTCTAGPNAVVSGLFFDGLKTSATAVATDAATEGQWVGTYGSQGYEIAGASSGLSAASSSSDAVTFSGASTYTWATGTSDPRVPENPSGSGLPAADCWYGQSVSIDVNLGDGQPHLVSVYALDYADSGRAEQFQVINAATGAVLDTEDVSSFSGGAYLNWVVTGNVIIKVTNFNGPNAIVSGVFISPLTS